MNHTHEYVGPNGKVRRTGGALPCSKCGHVEAVPAKKKKVAVAVATVAEEVVAKGMTKEKPPKGYESCLALGKKLGAIDCAQKVHQLIGPALAKEDQEVFILIPLDVRLQLKASPRELFRGGRAGVNIDKTIILGEAQRANAVAFVIVHNHPSGVPKPSKADRATTADLRKVAKSSGLTLVDHVVVGKGGRYYSFTENKTSPA
jgi:hypothetical protein